MLWVMAKFFTIYSLNFFYITSIIHPTTTRDMYGSVFTGLYVASIGRFLQLLNIYIYVHLYIYKKKIYKKKH